MGHQFNGTGRNASVELPARENENEMAAPIGQGVHPGLAVLAAALLQLLVADGPGMANRPSQSLIQHHVLLLMHHHVAHVLVVAGGGAVAPGLKQLDDRILGDGPVLELPGAAAKADHIQ